MTYQEMIFDRSESFRVIKTEKDDRKAVIYVESAQDGSNCPRCNELSNRVHSYYTRRVMDLPIVDNQTWLVLKARKFYCINTCCERKVFVERFRDHIMVSKRVTRRVNEKLLKIALLMGGNGGVPLCRTINIPASSSTLIRLIYQQPVKQNYDPRVLGIDDWAFKKRLRYGTVIVDLEKGKIIDLLPDREATSVQKWLKDHPGVKIVSRDRYSNYANGIKQASSSITQVADRWHLLKNLGDAMQKMLDRNIVSLKSVRDQQIREIKQEHDNVQPTKVENAGLLKGVLNKKFALVKQMLSEGHPIRKISRDANVTRNTIRKWKSFDVLPCKRSIKKTNMHLFDELVRKMLMENPAIETKEILKQITAMGYNGSTTAGYESVSRIRGKKSPDHTPKLPSVFWMPSKTSKLFYADRQKLSEKEKELVDNLCEQSEEIKNAAELIRDFRNMVETKDGALLNDWIERATIANIKEIKGFARGLLADIVAVQNGINLPWSNGPVEGQVNKLKLIKRQMYGRASFELLRKRMIIHQT